MPTLHHDGWMAQLLLQPKSRRPWVRMLTVRSHRPDRNEIDIEVALHDSSPLTTWATTAKAGDLAGIFEEGAVYRESGSSPCLLVADPSGLPATMAIIEAAPPEFSAQVFLQVNHRADVRSQVVDRDNVDVHWIVAGTDHDRARTELIEAVQAADLPSAGLVAWVVGEQRIPQLLRRHLTQDRGMAKQDVTFIGYWRQGHRSPG